MSQKLQQTAVKRKENVAVAEYLEFVRKKACIAQPAGFDITDDEINPLLKPHQKACVRWAVRGGRRALFESFGLGKSVQQLEILRLVLEKIGGGRGLIVAPLGVRQEFKRDAAMLGLEIIFVRRTEELNCGYCSGTGEVACSSTHCPECSGTGLRTGLFITNYESVRDGKLNPNLFAAISHDKNKKKQSRRSR
ncbi:MAG TPA: hypothetical protein VF648_21315 [Pyrinomonadaceae bacterium]|jgi:SNF2 family DNA or RNA helicase